MKELSPYLHLYPFWLGAISILCFILERIRPWRPKQRALRVGFAQDLFWLAFNGHFAGVALAYVAAWALSPLGRLLRIAHIPAPESLRLLGHAPLWLQFLMLLVLKDFLEWFIHNLLHRVPWLWEFHKLHHSIEELDFIGNLRFHWMESVVYKTLTYLPLVALGVDGQVILWVAVVDTLIGHLNHANLNLGWGPLRYLINSPRMHVWHHDVIARSGHGKNFGIVFSLWDFLFGTAYLPSEPSQPSKLGFDDMERFPKGLLSRLTYPLSRASSLQFEAWKR
jgi:sterol desaturase/sphingolipid hydroxylase (fatty acid hydroxylase superfamily)